MRKCPGCDFRKAGHEIDSCRFDFACPRCHKHSWSEFKEEPEPIIEPVHDTGDGYGWMACYLEWAKAKG